MSMTLRAILIVIGVLIVGAIIFDGWRRIRTANKRSANRVSKQRSFKAQPESLQRSQSKLSQEDPLFDDNNDAHRIEPILDASSVHDAGEYKDIYLDPQPAAASQPLHPSGHNYRRTSTPGSAAQQIDERDPEHNAVVLEKTGGDAKLLESIIVFHVLAKTKPAFDGPNVLQALLSMGLKHGDMSIFHRHEQTTGKGPIEFSVASIIEPGIFDLDAMGSFATPGLSLFLRIPGSCNPLNALDLMLETADKLAMRLGGEVVDQDFSPLTAEMAEVIRAEVAEISRHNAAATQA